MRVLVVVALIMLIFSKITSVVAPFSLKWAFDSLTSQTFQKDSAVFVLPVLLVIAYGAGRMLAMVFAQTRDFLFAKVAQNAVRNLALRTFEQLHRLSLRFHLDRRTGRLNRTIELGVRGIELIVRHTILGMLPTILELSLVFCILWIYFGVYYVLVTISTIVIYFWFTFVVSEKRVSIRRDMNDSDSEANAKVVDSLLNFETVKYFGNEQWECARFDRSMERYEKASVRTYSSLSWLNFGQSIIFDSGATACRALVILGIVNETLTIGDFVMLNALLFQLQMPLHFMGTIYRETKQGLVDIGNMIELLERSPEIVDKPGAPALKVNKGEIRFEKVQFGYAPDRRILNSLSFSVPPGKTVAIVGPSGAGKSTLSRLLFRFYDVTGGQILIDGQNIADVTQESLRAAIGIVPQDTVLFNETIEYNIRYGRLDASDEEVRRAARLAQVDEFVKRCPAGYRTMVGERGLKLSGGEKQRISIARMILKGPPILVLDEATSALDTQTERRVQGAFLNLARNGTTLVIAHRLSTVVDSDEILVLDAGEIVERGDHKTLLAMDGVYAAMWRRQLESGEIDEEGATVDAPNSAS